MAEITIRISDRTLKIAGALLIVILLSWLFVQLWQSGVLRAKYQLRLFLPDIQGLQVGAPVKLEGIPVGTVTSVDLDPNSSDSSRRIEVRLRLEKRFQNLIHEDSSAAVMTTSFLGGKQVTIQAGFAGPPIGPGGEIRVVPVKEASFTDLLDVLGRKPGCPNEGDSADAETSFPRAEKQSPTTRSPNVSH